MTLATLLGNVAALQEAAAPSDFRGYVFGAYTAAFVLLFIFSVFLAVRLGRIEADLRLLRESTPAARDPESEDLR